jgi:2-succinyl-5-enolpyruvyl-6-hydroxy-3-cyclohexene-1-carboxylate synthase
MPGLETAIGLRAFVDELVRCGMHHACTSPGSRSTPLVLALVRDGRLRTSSHIDERAAGFFALGQAKASGRPVALACTSGTAAANYAPAVIEAHEARVPLLVLTADRPPELRDLGAGQTIDQLKLYGSAAKWFMDVDDAAATPGRVRWLRQLACRAYWTALDGRPGAVHLNFALREPLIPGEPLPAEEPGGGGRPGGRPWLARPLTATAPPEQAVQGLTGALERRPRAILVAGRQERDGRLPGVLAALAERAAIPLLAEPLSGARRGRAAVAHYDALLRDPDWAAAHAPELVLRVGDLPTSKPLRTWLHGLEGAEQLALDPENAWQDPAGALQTIVPADAGALLEAVTGRIGARRDTTWLDAWRAADRGAAEAIAETLMPEGLSEPRVAAELGTWLPADATVIAGSSMPVRDVETFFPVRPDPPRVLANRGANGIDGTVSTAFGVAAATAGPAVALLGDVSLAYDIGGLLAARRTGARLVLVVINNDGGGIFHFLPVAGEADAFEQHVATPHGLDFEHAAALYGCAYARPDTPEAFREAVRRGLDADGSTLVEVRTDRDANVAVHRRVWDAVRRRAPAAAPRA